MQSLNEISLTDSQKENRCFVHVGIWREDSSKSNEYRKMNPDISEVQSQYACTFMFNIVTVTRLTFMFIQS